MTEQKKVSSDQAQVLVWSFGQIGTRNTTFWKTEPNWNWKSGKISLLLIFFKP